MHKQITVWRERIPCQAAEPEMTPELRLLFMVCDISAQMQENPVIVQENARTLWICYENACLPCELLSEGMGSALARIGESIPISLHGGTEGLEMARIEAVRASGGRELEITKYDISGKDFQELTGFGFRVHLRDEEECAFVQMLLSEAKFEKTFLAYPRTRRIEAACAGCVDPGRDMYYRYLPVGGSEDMDEALASLSLEKKKKLWELFIVDDLCAVEFEYVLDAYENGRLGGIFSWDMALRLALGEAGVTISYENRDFRVCRSTGERLYYSYESGNAAECLFLKLLFPVPVR